MHFFLKDEQYYAIINTSTGVWYNGSIGVSKTFDGSSILSTPAIWMLPQLLELNILKTLDFKRKISVFFCFYKEKNEIIMI